MIHRYSWKRVDYSGSEQKGLIDYVIVDERLRRCVMDARVVRGMVSGSDHYLVMARVKMETEWSFKCRKNEVKECRIKSEKLSEPEVRCEFERRLEDVLDGAQEEMDFGVENVWRTFAENVVAVAENECGVRAVGVQKGGGCAWWSDEVRQAVGEKKAAYKRSLQRNLPPSVREKRRKEYRECNKRVKKLVKESKKKADEEFGRKISEKFAENKKLF